MYLVFFSIYYECLNIKTLIIKQKSLKSDESENLKLICVLEDILKYNIYLFLYNTLSKYSNNNVSRETIATKARIQ